MGREGNSVKMPCAPKVLDTSAIIDGRILEVINAGFLEGTIVVAQFILQELRHIADSAERERRRRGRHGLDVLAAIQESLYVVIDYTDYTSGDVDTKLLRLAKRIKGKLVTTDYNLMKVAAVEQVPCMNVNQLANALRAAVLPGERLDLHLVQKGLRPRQAVGFLVDGTMVVVREADGLIGSTRPVTVTNVIQKEEGRIIFADVTRGAVEMSSPVLVQRSVP